MIVGISIFNFKGIRELINFSLDRFHVLVGPNASGKSAFLDAIDFVRDCLDAGPLDAVENRSVPDFDDLTFMRQGGNIEIELWLDIGHIIPSQEGNLLNYRIVIRKDNRLGVSVNEEMLKQYSKSWLPAGKKFEFSRRVLRLTLCDSINPFSPTIFAIFSHVF